MVINSDFVILNGVKNLCNHYGCCFLLCHTVLIGHNIGVCRK